MAISGAKVCRFTARSSLRVMTILCACGLLGLGASEMWTALLTFLVSSIDSVVSDVMTFPELTLVLARLRRSVQL